MFIKFRQEQSVDLLGSECSRMENWELTLGTNFKTRYPARSGGPGDVRAIHATQAARLATADSATKKRRALLGLKPHLETPERELPRCQVSYVAVQYEHAKVAEREVLGALDPGFAGVRSPCAR